MFKNFLKVMVSREVGTCFPKILVMDMHYLGPVTRCWKKKTVAHLFPEEMENMVETVGRIEDPLAREIGGDIHGRPPTALLTCPGGHLM